MKVRIATAAAMGLALLGLSGCGGSNGSASDNEITILLVAGTSGANTQAALDEKTALEVAADQINKRGGIDGKDVLVDTVDSKGDPTTAVSAYRGYVTSDGKPDVVFAGTASGETLALLPLLTRDKVLSFATTASALINDPNKYPYHFGVAPTSDDDLRPVAPFVEERGVEKLALFLGADAYGESVGAGIRKVLEGSGVDISVHRFNPADVDLSAAYRKMIDSNPDAVFTDAFGDAAARILDAREKVGATAVPTMTGLSIPATGNGPAEFSTAKAQENVSMLLFAVQNFVAPGDRTPAFNSFYDAYVTASGGTVKSSILAAAFAYDGMMLLETAADQSKSTDLDKLVDALENLESPADPRWITENTFD